VLFITLDQIRGDVVGDGRHAAVRTPTLDRLSATGVRFARHYSQAAPCAPGRAALYTGTYQFNNRVVANGTPLDRRFDNLALAAQRAGYRPALFGYTDQAADPRMIDDPDDPRLREWEGVLPGFEAELLLIDSQLPWRRWLAELGHRVDLGDPSGEPTLATEPQRPAEHSHSAFMTDRFVAWLETTGSEPWFAHLSYLRPHPPYAAAGEFSEMYEPESMPMPIRPSEQRHRLHEALCQLEATAAPTDRSGMQSLIAQYYGMISEVDHQVGRVLDAIERLGHADQTVVVLTADHGEQLGDHGYIEKAGFFEESYHIPAIVSDPRRPESHGRTVDAFTENVDLFPTICDLVGLEIPQQCDGASLTGFLEPDLGDLSGWRTAAHWEYDWRFVMLGTDPPDARARQRLATQHLAVVRAAEAAYVQFGDGSALAFDLASDPTWRTPLEDPQQVISLTQEMLTWRSTKADRILANTLVGMDATGALRGIDPRTRANL